MTDAFSLNINDTSGIISPGLVLFREIMEFNLDEMARQAGDINRLRPHCKTHKMPEVIRILLDRGITKHKCATFAEAEMLAGCGVKDICLAYNMVGPNVQRAVAFKEAYPDVTLIVTADHLGPLQQLSAAAVAADQEVEVLIDLDTGQHRTGIEYGPEAVELYRQMHELPGIIPGGIHLYDGQNHQTDLQERIDAVTACWQTASALKADLEQQGMTVPRVVAGGTGSFPIYASLGDPVIEASPGTNIFFDSNYGKMFPDLKYIPAMRILSRVISCPSNGRVTFDLGYKACASDPPAGSRVVIPSISDADAVLQNEEHLVIKTDSHSEFTPGDEILAIPAHVCPTSALHKSVYVVENGEVVDQWEITARDRKINI